MSWDFTGSLLKVSGIGPGLFAGKSIKSFTTNIYFTERGERAFENCTQLEQVNLMLDYVPADQKLERIGYRAFAGTTSLKSFIFPEDVTFIEPEVLRGSGVQEIRVEGAYEIKSRAFADCPNLTYICRLPQCFLRKIWSRIMTDLLSIARKLRKRGSGRKRGISLHLPKKILLAEGNIWFPSQFNLIPM